MQNIKIPKERVAVLIGKHGKIKRDIQKILSVKLTIDSEEGDVTISGDPINELTARDIVLAIGRGFSPEHAMELCNEDYVFELIEIKEYAGKSKKKRERLKARLIGTKGKARKLIETLTGTAISVYGKTVCIIGEVENVYAAKHAIEMLLKGAKHGNVFGWLERKRAGKI